MTAEQAISWLSLKPKNLPVFVLVATDPVAPQVISHWRALAKIEGVNEKKLNGARVVMDEFFAWQEKKLPG